LKQQKLNLKKGSKQNIKQRKSKGIKKFKNWETVSVFELTNSIKT
jgi:hypothetical protein